MGIGDMSTATPEERESARRMADAVNVHVAAYRETASQRSGPPWIGIRLSDGRCPDGTAYDSREDCVRHLVADDPYVFPVKIQPETISPSEAWVLLGYARQAKARGVAFHHENPVLPERLELVAPLMPRIVGGASTLHRPPAGIPASFWRGQNR